MALRVSLQPLPAEAGPEQPALPAVELAEVVERAQAESDVLGYPVEYLRGLPLPTTLLCELQPALRFVVTTSRAAFEACQAARVPALTASEVCVLALAVANDRASSHELRGWLQAKARGAWALTAAYALGVPAEQGIEGARFGWLFDQLEVVLVADGVGIGDAEGVRLVELAQHGGQQ